MGEQVERKPWEQMEGEPKKAYACFLLYRDLGPLRSLDKAWAVYCRAAATKSNEKQPLSGSWTNWSSRYHWPDRAHDWDIENAGRVGGAVATAFLEGLRVGALKALEKLQADGVAPRNWEGALDALLRIGNYIPAETIAALRDNAQSDRTPAIGATGQQPTGDYRSVLALVASRPNGDSESSSQDQSGGDGAQVGEVRDGRGDLNA